MDGSLLVCRTGEGGRLDRISDFKRHKGIGFESVLRQEGPHVHSTQVSADGRRLYAADLGLDHKTCRSIHREEWGRVILYSAKTTDSCMW